MERRRRGRTARVGTRAVATATLALAACLLFAASASAGSPWTVEKSANAGTPPNGGLISVACPSSTRCIAVGGFSAPNPSQNPDALIERWNGSTWSIQSNPASGALGSLLESVSCPTTKECLAAGYIQHANGQPFVPLVLQYDGSRWRADTVPVPPSGDGQLYGIS